MQLGTAVEHRFGKDGVIFNLSGSTGSRPDEALPFSLSFSCSFQHLLDVSQVAAVQVGDIQIPLE